MSEVPTDRRKVPRFRVQFRSSFTTEYRIDGEGTVIDLSIGGCRVGSDTMVPAGSHLELSIHVSGLDEPIRIERALVPWSSNRQFGVGFIRIPPGEQKRLSKVVQELETDASEE